MNWFKRLCRWFTIKWLNTNDARKNHAEHTCSPCFFHSLSLSLCLPSPLPFLIHEHTISLSLSLLIIRFSLELRLNPWHEMPVFHVRLTSNLLKFKMLDSYLRFLPHSFFSPTKYFVNNEVQGHLFEIYAEVLPQDRNPQSWMNLFRKVFSAGRKIICAKFQAHNPLYLG